MIQTVDFLILDLIQNKLRCKFLDSLMIKCSSLGDGGIIWIAISFLLICYKKYRQAGVLILISVLPYYVIIHCRSRFVAHRYNVCVSRIFVGKCHCVFKIISIHSLSVRYYRRNCVRYNYRTLRMLIIARFQTISHRAAEQLK